jgi:hypothetical protein
MEINPDKIELENLSKSFEYFKVASEIDSIDDLEMVKIVAKCYYKLYLKQQEVVSNLAKLGVSDAK